MNLMTSSRRNFLKGAGVTLTLPWLESMGGLLHAADAASEPRRLLLICLPLGIYRDAFIPQETGTGYQPTEYLSLIDAFRDSYTLISGLDHPGVSGGHSAQPRIFTGQPSGEPNRLSLDQRLAEEVGRFTRYDALGLSAGANDFSWTSSGSMVPAEKQIGDAYAKLFADEGAENKEKVLRQIGKGKSIMDFVQDQAASLKPRLSKTDQEKLNEYFESVRETERRLTKSESWVHTPKPEVNGKPITDPQDRNDIISDIRNVCDLTYLAFKTDSTRIVSFGYFRQGDVTIPGVDIAYHALSHHGKEESNIAQLKIIERVFFEELNRLMKNLKEAKEGDATLLDRTTILVTSNLGNGSNHSNKDLPVLLAGGRYEHGQHLAFEPSTVPLSNLYVSVLNQFGLPDSSFGTSTGPLQGLQIL